MMEVGVEEEGCQESRLHRRPGDKGGGRAVLLGKQFVCHFL
jgi:hypothetical protein